MTFADVAVMADRDLTLPDDPDAVISTLDKRSYQDTDPVCAAGVANLVAAMHRQGIQRIAAVSASPALPSGVGEPWWFRRTVRPLVRRKGRHLYSDTAAMESVLRSSSSMCDWTILRPGYLTDKSAAGYRLVPEANSISSVRRADLAAALIAVVNDPDTIRRAYGIVRGDVSQEHVIRTEAGAGMRTRAARAMRTLGTKGRLRVGFLADGLVKIIFAVAYAVAVAPIGRLLDVGALLILATAPIMVLSGLAEAAFARRRAAASHVWYLVAYDSGWLLVTVLCVILARQGASMGGEIWFAYQAFASAVLATAFAIGARSRSGR